MTRTAKIQPVAPPPAAIYGEDPKNLTKVSELEHKPSSSSGGPLWSSMRFRVALISCLGTAANYSLRVNLSVGIVCMLNATAISQIGKAASNSTNMELITDEEDECADYSINSTHETRWSMDDGEFAWSKEYQGLLLGALFWGYMIPQIPAGILSHAIGGKRVMAYSMLLAAVATLLSPAGARFNFYAFYVLRIIVGIGLAPQYSATHKVLSSWAPPKERSILGSLGFAGAQGGVAICLPLAAVLCDNFGWESIFYVTGAIALVWTAAYALLVTETPSQHKRISPQERKFIEAELMHVVAYQQKEEKITELPWLKFFTSASTIAMFVAHATSNYGNYLMLTTMPTFMNEVLKFNIKSNGFYSALPYVAFFVMVNVGGLAADSLRRSKLLTTGQTRKLMVTTASMGQAVFFIAAGYCQCGQQILAVTFMVLAVGISGVQIPGYLVNPADLAPQYAGVLFSVSNMFATIPGVIAPEISSLITKHGTREEWLLVFWITAGVLAFGTIVFLIFGQGEIQPWAKSKGEGDQHLSVNETDTERNDRNVESADKNNKPNKTMPET